MRFVCGRTILLLFISIAAVIGCDSNKQECLQIKSGGDSFVVVLKKGTPNYMECSLGDSIVSKWRLNFPAFKFIKGDVNGDEDEDLIVGVIKPTRRDSVSRKRLFLFQVKNKIIIPLWLGSSLSHPLEDFNYLKIKKRRLIRTVEQDEKGRYLVADYEWRSFGLNFNNYIKRGLTLPQAKELLFN